MNWCLASSHSPEHAPVRELTLRNHANYATRHCMDMAFLVKPWDAGSDAGIHMLIDLLGRYDAVMALGSDVIITNPDKGPDQFMYPAIGAVVSAEDIGGCSINNDTAVWCGFFGKLILWHLLAHKKRAVEHKWLWQGLLAELINEPTIGGLVKVVPQTELQSLPDWEYSDKACRWKPGHFSCHFLMGHKVERMTRFLTEHPEFK